MSDNDSPGSSSDEEDLRTTGLIATRAKRSTAGNLYATLRQNLDDEELQKELLAEDEEDVGEYEGSDKDGDDDEAMESSDDEDDSGPPNEGEAEELEGERELKKAERADARKKRKLEQAKLRVNGWRQKKRVKLADDAKPEDGTPERPKKKSDRSNWPATGVDGPIRQSERASAVASREITHAHLKQSAARSEKQRKVMKNAAERERANKRAQLTQEERLAKAARIEKETSREFGRWEREEAERQRIREEQLAAKRRRGFDGPVVRHWSGSVLWEGEKITVKRLHGGKPVDEIKDEAGKTESNGDTDDALLASNSSTMKTGLPDLGDDRSNTTPSQQLLREQTDNQTTPTAALPGTATAPCAPEKMTELSQASEQRDQSQTTWLQGIHEYAIQPTSDDQIQPDNALPPVQEPKTPLYMPSAPSIHTPVEALMPLVQQPIPPMQQHLQQQQVQAQPHSTSQFSTAITPQAQVSGPLIPQQSSAQMYHVWAPGPQQSPLPQLPNPPPHPPAVPLVREQAQRSLVMLEQFEKLDAPAPSKRGSGRHSKDTVLEPNALASTMFPGSYPSFTPEESRYLTAKMRKRGPEHTLPPAPVKTRCAVTSWPAKFRDPKTGLPYAELQTYKMIQRLLAGGCAWSGFLGAWVGPTYGPMGRPAKGVPDGFAAAAAAATVAPPPKPAVVQTEAKGEETSGSP